MNEKRDYIDHDDFHDVTRGPAFQEWTAGMEQYRPDHTRQLDGTLRLQRPDGAILELTLADRAGHWQVVSAPAAGATEPDWFARPAGAGQLTVLPLPGGIYFIDVIIDQEQAAAATCATVVYDRPRSRALVIYTWTFALGDTRRTRSRIDAVGVGGPAAEPIERTADLVGRRAMWVYSDNHAYEHIYLNYGTYAWHCLAGPERSIADVDQTRTYKISDAIYVFFVTETVFPWDGVFVLDFTPGRMTNIGRFFGWDPKPNRLAHSTFGARGRILNQTEYVF
ncbi:MAG: hypothetical protein IT480_02935 [Gammaproteobacteria bacterium]|nr:hypothetical protein [Gammaproteobacteria bacterium]